MAKVRVKLPDGMIGPYFGVESGCVYVIDSSTRPGENEVIVFCDENKSSKVTYLHADWCTPVCEYEIVLPEDLFE